MYELKQKLVAQYKMDEDEFILSMGTSNDFEEAVFLINHFIVKYRSQKELTK